jgi:predicted metal-dependent hydrolase
MMKTYSIAYGNEYIAFNLMFDESRTGKVAIHVFPDTTVHVDAPVKTPIKKIKAAVQKRARWIVNNRQSYRQQNLHVFPREYVSGESHYYLGRRYTLKIILNKTGDEGVKLKNGQLQVSTHKRTNEHIKDLLNTWYTTRALAVFNQRIESLAKTHRWVKQMPPLRLRTMKKQWGSCSPKGALSLNLHLIKAPKACIDYVISHELCHLKHHDHSKQFYSLLSRKDPKWRLTKERLDSLAPVLLNH